MKYRLKSVRRKKSTAYSPVPLLPVCKRIRAERINIDALFEVGELPTPPKAPKRTRNSLKKILSAAYKKLRLGMSALLLKIRRHRENARKKYPRISFYFGVLCSVCIVSLLSVAVVLVGLFGSFLMPYQTVSYPALTGLLFSDIQSSTEEHFDLIVDYKYSEQIPAGTVISQSPDGGATRRLYDGNDKATITLTVSAGRRFYTVEPLSGLTLRDARLLLKNAAVSINGIGEYSDTVAAGTVISTSPAEGERIYSGEAITLKYSLGRHIPTAKIPDLYGLGEAQACSLLVSRNLSVGKISYVSSSADAGKVIAQEPRALESVPEGTEVSLTVSLGRTQQKNVPELYGLTLSEAKQRLSEFGLVIGGIFPVESAVASGSVVTQQPSAGTPITSSITAVDIYISS